MPNRLPKPLRTLWRLAIGILVLAAAAAGLRFWLDARGRAILAKYPPRPAAPARPSMPGSGEPRRIPVRDLPYFAEPNPGDPNSDLLQKLRTDWTDILKHVFDANGDPDFIALLSHVKEPVPEGMTQAEAAVAFLQFARKFDPLIDSLRDAVAAGKWDLASLKTEVASNKQNVFSLMLSGSNLIRVRTQAEWLAGRPDAAAADFRPIAALGRQMDEPGDLLQGVVGGALRANFFHTIGSGLMPSALRDLDLAAVQEEMGQMPDPLATFRLAAQGERQNAPRLLADFLNHPEVIDESIAKKYKTMPSDLTSKLGEMLEHWAIRHMSDTQIAANAAVIDRQHQLTEDSFDYEKRQYSPPSPKAKVEVYGLPPGQTPSYLDRLYLLLAEDGSPYNPAAAPLMEQSLLDQTRLALALEKHKRANGAHPDSLTAVAAAFPSGLPHDVATGAPYFYEKTAAGGIRLWGTGSDRKNDGGTRLKDAVLKLPEPR